MCVKKNKNKNLTSACRKGTENNRKLQVFRTINHEIREKFHQRGLILDDFCKKGDEIIFSAHIKGSSARCPCCGMISSHVKAYRPRKLQDIEFLDTHTTLQLRVRLFRCQNQECMKKSFVEPLKVASPYARKTKDVSRRIEYASLNQSARLASNTLLQQHINASRSTCIRSATKLGCDNPDIVCSGYVAIDDWAYRKGHVYMCSIVDHWTRKPVAVFNGRYVGQIAEWFADHPEVKLVSRDGSREYASLIKAGRPEAIQVTDRFHLIKNLKEDMIDAIRKMLGHKAKEKLKHVYPTAEEALRMIKEDIADMGDGRHRRKVREYFQIRQMQEDGKSLSEMSEIMKKWPQKIHELGRMHISKVLTKDQYKALSNAREMATVIANGTISKDAVARKLEGKLESRIVCRCMRRITEKYSEHRQMVREHNRRIAETGKGVRIRKDAIWEYIRTGKTTCKNLIRLKVTHPQIDKVINSCISFMDMISAREGAPDVDSWIKEAKECVCKELYRFADYIESDKEAVRQAYMTKYSNGIMEGTVNKIKAIKRSMFNRAGVNLLRAKIILANYEQTCH